MPSDRSIGAILLSESWTAPGSWRSSNHTIGVDAFRWGVQAIGVAGGGVRPKRGRKPL